MKPLKNIFSIFLPIIMVSFYLFVLSEERFTSTSKFTIKSDNETTTSPLAMGIIGGTSAGTQDQLIIRDRITSFDMTQKIIEHFGLEKHITAQSTDFLWKLSDINDIISINKQIQKLITFTYDEEAAISTLAVQSFGPIAAQELNEFLLSETVSFINAFNKENSNRFVEFAETEAQEYRVKLTHALDKLQKHQEEFAILDPQASAEQTSSSISRIEDQIKEETIKLEEMLSYLQEDSYRVTTAKNKIETLNTMLAEAQHKISNLEDTDITEINRKFYELKGDVEFAQQAYQSALITLETAQQKAMQSQKNLMVIENPSLPNKSQSPHILKFFIVSLLAIFIFNLIVRLGINLIKEYN